MRSRILAVSRSASRLRPRGRRVAIWLGLMLAAATLNLNPGVGAQGGPSAGGAASPFETALQSLRFREIGPANMGGRVDDFAVVERDPATIYVGTASAGVWKTTNAGVTWEPVFDDQAVSTIGDVTLAPSDPSIVWVGTGESNNRQSSSWGNGVHRSTDAGRTWTHLGLADSHHIGRIVVHPTDPDTAYVAAAGRLWGPNKERGVFKTSDGGRTWQHVLFVDEDTGVNDLAMDPVSPDTLYAAAYQRRRTVFGFNGGGPGSALYKTTDGGRTWRRLTAGLPYAGGGDTGRIGLDIYRRNPDVVYALVEHRDGGLFRSEDRGETWTKMSATNPRPMYYSQVRIDPNNDLRIWVLGAPMYYSEDGGKTFTTERVTRIHGDHHALWINPADSRHMVLGSDGGVHVSHDAGRTWDYVNSLALGQFYEIGVDMRKPYYVCGGLQDNGSWCGPSRTTYTQGITNEDWYRIGGGDGFYAQIDPTDSNIVYTESQDGNVIRRDLRTNESRSIRPPEEEGEARYRFQWNSPFVISAHDSSVLYYGGNFLFKSTDRGDSWTKLGGDLTSGADRTEIAIMGRMPDREMRSRHDGVAAWPAATTLSESPRRPDVLWVGTDDGHVQVTRDGGRSWKNVVDRVPGVPKGTYVSRLVASRHADGTAYLTFDGHRMNDFTVYVFVTTDFGESWKPISKGLPADNGVVNVIREHHRNPNLLFAGTEYGAFFSVDRGGSWHRLKMNLPTVPVDDIAVHPRENDLVLGTHGRSIWILDDLTPLEQLDDPVLGADLHLFDLRPATAWRIYGHKGNLGHKVFAAPNPPYGALISYYLKAAADAKTPAKIAVLDREGRTVRELDGPGRAGINRTSWDLRYGLPEMTDEQRQAFGGGFGAGLRGPMAEPGEYTVRVTVGSRQATKPVRVEEDPRITIAPQDRAARHAALMRLFEAGRAALEGQRTIAGIRTGLGRAMEAWRRPRGAAVPDSVRQQAEALAKEADAVAAIFMRVDPPGELGAAGPPLVTLPPTLPQRITRLFGQLDGFTAAPTAWQQRELEAIGRAAADATARVTKVDEGLASLNKLMNQAGVPHIRAGR